MPNCTVSLCVYQEELRAQLPRYQCKIPSTGQAHISTPPVGSMGGVMPAQQGASQQPGARHPMHGTIPFLITFHMK